MKSGIYKIVNLQNSKKYIGSAVNLKRREYEHFRMLEKGIHYNSYLQASYNKYGKDSFRFEIVTECCKEELINLEQYYLDSLKPEYNGCKTAGSMLGFKFSDETKALKSKQATQQIKNQKAQGLTNSKLKLTSKEVFEIKKLIAYNWSGREIAKIYKVADSTINAIKKHTTWNDIPDYIVPKEEKHLIKNFDPRIVWKVTYSDELLLNIIKDSKLGLKQFELVKKYNLNKGTISGLLNKRFRAYLWNMI